MRSCELCTYGKFAAQNRVTFSRVCTR